MFTMAKIRGGSTYLERHLTANDYYCENETVVGQWVGRAAEHLGLRGEIHAGDRSFESLRKNRHPDGAGKLTPRDGPNRVRFYDFQCSAQKSVSIMAVTLGDTRLLEAHDAAAKLAFGELEKFAARQANTVMTRSNVRTANIVAASFRHTASRALDPQVHTHFVTANATWDESSKSWRALTEFEMVSAIRYAGKVYQNEMARSCLLLGYNIEEIRDRQGRVTGFEISGVPAAVRALFSKRRADIEVGITTFRKEHGREPTAGEIHAISVATRDPKLAEATTPAVLAAQRAQLAPAELRGMENLRDRAIARSREAGFALSPGRERESLLFAAADLFERRSVIKGHALLAEALNQNLGHIELPRLEAYARKAELVGLSGGAWLHEDFATGNGLAQERWAVDFVDRTRGQFQPLGPAKPELSPQLSPEQRKAACKVLASRDQVVCLRGAAGVGKSTVLAEIWREIEATGATCFACAPTSSAADTLRKAGLPATTLADFLKNTAFCERDRLEGAVLIVDESGLLSNRHGAELLGLAEHHNARVLFLGDSRQHSAVEAGDFLRVLEAHSELDRVQLDAIRRQEHLAYREAIGCMANGAARLGLERLDGLGWVKEGRSNYLRAAAADFVRVLRGGRHSVLAVTPTWAEHEAFTLEVRALLKASGVLGPSAEFAAHEPLKWTRAQARNPATYQPGLVATFSRTWGPFRPGDFASVTRVEGKAVFARTPNGERRLPIRADAFVVCRPRPIEVAVGDRILIRANDRSARLLNGEILTVGRIEGERLHGTDGRVIDTARFREFIHGYAVTSHASQSKTVDHVIVAAERLDAKAAYVACSRGRFTCTLHTPDKAAMFDRLPSGNRAAALDMIKASRLQAKACTLDRTALWARAREHLRALRITATKVLDRGRSIYGEQVRRACYNRALLGVDSRQMERTRQRELDRT